MPAQTVRARPSSAKAGPTYESLRPRLISTSEPDSIWRKYERASIFLPGAGGVACLGVLLSHNRAAGTGGPAGRCRRPGRAAGWTATRTAAGRRGPRAGAGHVHALPWSQPDCELVGLHQGWVAGPHRHHGEAAGARARNHLVVPGDALPDQGRPGRGADLGSGDRHDQGVAGAHAWLAAARLARRRGRVDLVDRPVCQQARTPRSADRPDPRVRRARQQPAARSGGGSPGEHLVHGHSEGRDRPARPAHRAGAASIRSTSRARAGRTRRFWMRAAATCSSRCSRGTSAGSTPPAARW